MSIIRNRELSQFGSFIYIDNASQKIGITTEATPFVGIGTPDPVAKLHVVGNTNLEGNVNIINGTLDASSYTLDGNPLVNAEIQYWTFATGEVDIYRLQGNVGIGTSVFTQKLTVIGNVSAGQFISTVTSGTAPLVVLSDTQVTNLNASFIRGKVPPISTIVGTTDTQTLTNKTLTSPIITGGSFSSPTITGGIFSSAGITINGSTSGSTVLQASAVASGTLTLPATTTTLVGRNTTDTLTNKTLSADSNTITGLTNTNLSGTAGITNANLANSTISGVSLGSNLFSLSFGSGIVASSSYNGSTAVTISAVAVGGTSDNTANTIVARDISGDFTAGSVNLSNLNVSQTITGVNIDATNIQHSGNTFSGANDTTITTTSLRSVIGPGVLHLCNNDSVGTSNVLTIQRSASNGNVARFVRGTSSVGTITVTTIATAYNTNSDYRLKENIVALDGAIERLNQLSVHRFNFIEVPDTVVDGFIAHEAAAVVPESVTGTKDEVDDDGNPVYQGIDQSKLVPLLTAALQESIAKIEQLEQRLAAAGIA